MLKIDWKNLTTKELWNALLLQKKLEASKMSLIAEKQRIMLRLRRVIKSFGKKPPQHYFWHKTTKNLIEQRINNAKTHKKRSYFDRVAKIHKYGFHYLHEFSKNRNNSNTCLILRNHFNCILQWPKSADAWKHKSWKFYVSSFLKTSSLVNQITGKVRFY